jgi:hypothetical protein
VCCKEESRAVRCKTYIPRLKEEGRGEERGEGRSERREKKTEKGEEK